MWCLLVEGFFPECRALDSGADARRSAQPAERNYREAKASRGGILTSCHMPNKLTSGSAAGSRSGSTAVAEAPETDSLAELSPSGSEPGASV